MVDEKIQHIRVGTERVAYCGVALGPEKSAFFGVDNAIKAMKVYHDVAPCHRCAKVVIEWMTKVQESTPAGTSGA